MQLFVSYARPDRLRVDSLVIRLRQAGIGVWLDSDLIGGWPWWDKILGQLQSCDAVLAAMSRASINSQACRSERDYAAQLGKPILPITLERMPAGLFPVDIAQLQVIDYTQPDEASGIRLATAIFALPKPGPLPDPLPPPPPVPQTRFGNLNDRIAAPSLTVEQQLGIIGQLEGELGFTSDQEGQETAAEMLSEMAKRPDLYEVAARKIQALQAVAPQLVPAAGRSAEVAAVSRPLPGIPLSSTKEPTVSAHTPGKPVRKKRSLRRRLLWTLGIVVVCNVGGDALASSLFPPDYSNPNAPGFGPASVLDLVFLLGGIIAVIAVLLFALRGRRSR